MKAFLKVLVTTFALISIFSVNAQVKNGSDANQKVSEDKLEKQRMLGIVLPEDYFSRREETAYKISPDGLRVAYLKLVSERYQLYVRTLSDSKERPVTKFTEGELTDFDWVSNDAVVYTSTAEGINTNGLFLALVDFPGKDVVLSKRGYHGSLVKTCGIIPGKFFYTSDTRVVGAPDLFVYELSKRESSLISENMGSILTWIVDRKGTLRGGISCAGDHLDFVSLAIGGKILSTLPLTKGESIQPVCFDASNEKLYCISNHGREFYAAVTMNVEQTKETSELYAPGDCNVISLIEDRAAKMACGAISKPFKYNGKIWNDKISTIYEKIKVKAPRGSFAQIVSMDDTGNLMIIQTQSGAYPEEYFIYDVKKDELKELGKRRMSPRVENISESRRLQVTSKNGYNFNAFVTKPKGADNALGLVVLLRNDPWSSTNWEYNDEVHFFAACGYYVMQIDQIGSSSNGKKNVVSGYGEVDGKMIDDIISAIEKAKIDNAYSGRKLIIYGKGLAGHMALMAISKYPSLFSGAVIHNGFSSLDSYTGSLFQNSGDCSKYDFVRYSNNEGSMDAMSILTRESLKEMGDKEVFLSAGMLDPNGGEVLSLESALKELGFGIKTYYKENEGAQFTNSENRFGYYRELAEYLKQASDGKK